MSELPTTEKPSPSGGLSLHPAFYIMFVSPISGGLTTVAHWDWHG